MGTLADVQKIIDDVKDKLLSELHDYVNTLKSEGNLREYEFEALKKWILEHVSEEVYRKKAGW